MPKYTAKQSIGHFMPGDEIKGLEAKQLQALLASGAIEAYQAPKPPVADDSAKRLADLEKANAELVETNKALTTYKDKIDQEVTELKAKVAELEMAKPAAKPKAGDKPTDETK